LQQQHPVFQTKLTSVRPPGWKFLQQQVNELFLVSQSGEKREVHILCEPGFTPTLHRDTANEAKAPVLLPTKAFNLDRSRKHARQVDHDNRLW
jgi:hypothetical protein